MQAGFQIAAPSLALLPHPLKPRSLLHVIKRRGKVNHHVGGEGEAKAEVGREVVVAIKAFSEVSVIQIISQEVLVARTARFLIGGQLLAKEPRERDMFPHRGKRWSRVAMVRNYEPTAPMLNVAK